MKRVEEKLVLKKNIKIALQKMMFVTIIGLSLMIGIKNHPSTKEWIQKNIFESGLPIIKIRNFYEKYMSIIPKEETSPVWKENHISQKEEKTDTGIKLRVNPQEEIQNRESGILIYISNDKTILEQVDGVTAIYHNIDVKNYKLYDYLEKGDILGVAKTNEVVIDYKKGGESFEYQKNI